ncbi:hypothetical protein ANN_02748 [Periplaneta americana]|uniref:Uncharacterized protein n=1 Tax=Periplaneta americana TaxID=6978 RepID=A0ABQ8TX36_PERAM|nr:hypothetical protein ANN_02748 [Periplaneta americana]
MGKSIAASGIELATPQFVAQHFNRDVTEYTDKRITEKADCLTWFRLGAWRALKIVNEEEARICPLCGRSETSHHILSECEATEALRKRFLPESIITSSRGHLATYDILNNAKFCESMGKFMAKVRQLRVELTEGEGAEEIREELFISVVMSSINTERMSVPQESRSRGLHGALRDGARRREERGKGLRGEGDCARSWLRSEGGTDPPESSREVRRSSSVRDDSRMDTRVELSRLRRCGTDSSKKSADEARSVRTVTAATPPNVRGIIKAAITHPTVQTLHRLTFTSSDQ